MRRSCFFFAVLLITCLSIGDTARAQQYKLRQTNSMMGMKSESTIYVKGMRKRTEGGSIMGIANNVATIEQCDLQRRVKINDKKKLYFIEPFAKETEEVIDDDEKPAAAKTKPAPPVSNTPKDKTTPQTGGVISTWYSIIDTGERKKMYGFNARHVWTYQKVKPSADACTMKDSIVVKTDGWYIDLPQFNCPVQYHPDRPATRPNEMPKPDCKDRFISHRSGKGKLGFPLIETRTMKMGNAGAQTSDFETSIETLEFTTTKLDSMLFEIPPGYTEVASEDALREKLSISDMIKDAGKNISQGQDKTSGNEQKKPGMIRIGVYEPKGDEQVQAPSLQQYMVNTLTGGNIDAITIASEEDAKKYHCDYTLATEFSKIKQGGKVGGFLKAIKNSDPNAMSSYTIEASQTLVSLSDGSTRAQPKIDGKYDGKVDDAAKKALDDGCRQVLKALK